MDMQNRPFMNRDRLCSHNFLLSMLKQNNDGTHRLLSWIVWYYPLFVFNLTNSIYHTVIHFATGPIHNLEFDVQCKFRTDLSL